MSSCEAGASSVPYEGTPGVTKGSRSGLAELEASCERRHQEVTQQLELLMARQERLFEIVTGVHERRLSKLKSGTVEAAAKAEGSEHMDSSCSTTLGEPDQLERKSSQRQSVLSTESPVLQAVSAREAELKHQAMDLAREAERTHTLSEEGLEEVAKPSLIARLGQSRAIECTLMVLILMDAVCMGIEVECDARSHTNDSRAFFAVRQVFNAAFVVELTIRVLAEGTAFFMSPQVGLNLIDAALVILPIVGMVIKEVTPGEKFANGIAAIRIIRTMRIFRGIRLVRHVRSLFVLIYSIGSAFRSLIWTMLLLLMFFYIFGLMFTQAVTAHLREVKGTGAETADLERFFGDIPHSIFTLFKSVAGGISWTECVDPLIEVGWFWVALFSFFIGFVMLAVMNVVTGVFCQIAVENAEKDKDLLMQKHLAQKDEKAKELKNLFECIDHDNDGTLNLSELHRGFQDDKVQAYFTAMDISLDDAWHLFKLLDTDQTHSVQMEEFVDGCLRLRGSARSMDVALLIYENRFLVSLFNEWTGILKENAENLPLLLNSDALPTSLRDDCASSAAQVPADESHNV